MLYDPKWQNTTTKPDVFLLESLIAWLEKQPAAEEYCYFDNGGCLLHKYFSAHGWRNFEIGGFNYWPENSPYDSKPLPYGFEDVSAERPHTFGAALDRARATLDR